MRIIVAAVGKVGAPGIREAVTDYESRAARYWPIEVKVVRAEAGHGSAPDVVRTREGGRLLEVAGPRAHLVACDPGGASMTSEGFAAWLQRMREGPTDVCFAIGGAYGLSADVIAAARTRLSLAGWTLPHEMARLVLAEQLYRAGTIVRREPYHK